MPAREVRTLSLLLLVAAATGCARYARLAVDTPTLAATTTTPPAAMDYEAAVRYAVEHNPDLMALRAKAFAVNVQVPPKPIEIEGGIDSDARPQAMLTLDALSLLGIGPRQAEKALARARRAELWLVHHERARDIAAELAETFAVDRALANLVRPEVDLRADAYVRAGLAPAAAESAVRATQAELAAEQAAYEVARRNNRRDFLRLLGARADASAAMLPSPEGWPTPPRPDERTLLASRADLQRLLAAYEVAEAEVRKAVIAQYPNVGLRPGIATDPTDLFGFVVLTIPVGAGPEVHARASARDAARYDLQGAVLDALRDAENSREEADVARSRRVAANAAWIGYGDLFRAARARLEVESGTFTEAVLSAQAAVAAATELREASVEEARARVRAARAAGWPPPLLAPSRPVPCR